MGPVREISASSSRGRRRRAPLVIAAELLALALAVPGAPALLTGSQGQADLWLPSPELRKVRFEFTATHVNCGVLVYGYPTTHATGTEGRSKSKKIIQLHRRCLTGRLTRSILLRSRLLLEPSAGSMPAGPQEAQCADYHRMMTFCFFHLQSRAFVARYGWQRYASFPGASFVHSAMQLARQSTGGSSAFAASGATAARASSCRRPTRDVAGTSQFQAVRFAVSIKACTISKHQYH